MAGELQGMRAELEQRVEQRTREFVRAARLAGLGTLAAGIAHEINNPLASIASCAEGLERKLRNGGTTPEQQRDYLQIIAKEAYRAHEITSRLLEFARSDPGSPVTFAFGDLMRGIDVLLESRLRGRALRLELGCDPDLPPIRGHPSECKQVVLNLLHNAIDASPRGGTIRLTCRREGTEAVLEVEDQGPGIPPEQIDRIFDPFFTTKEPGKGTGLGLAIVHRIVEAHGGHIEAHNTGGGALFRVRVPLASSPA
jgi:signal transduction histidine kinase